VITDHGKSKLTLEKTTMSEKNRQMFQHIKALNLPSGQYAITGSGPLGIRQLREIGDVDIIVSAELWDVLAAHYGVINENGIKRIVFPDGIVEVLREGSFYMQNNDPNVLTVAKRIAQAEMIDGLPFESLDHILYFKRKMGREKDLNDILIIEAWKKEHLENRSYMSLLIKLLRVANHHLMLR
jgi:hypothetical protein